MRRKPLYHHREWQSLAVLTVVAIGLLIAHQRARTTKEGSRADRAARAVLVPLQETITVVWQWTAHTAGGLARARKLSEENEKLRQANAQLEARLLQRQRLYLESLDIIKAFGLEPAPAQTEIRARVVGRSPKRFMRQVIDVVAVDGREIRKQDIVLWSDYLVGRVQAADGDRAKVTLLLDPDSGVAAVVQPSNAMGAIMGPDPGSRDAGLLRLVHLDRNAPLAVGDKVYTSDVGEVYPKGILIGVVEEVTGGAGTAEPKVALVQPYVDFGDLSYVTIMRPSAP